ncbi:MAG: hypothetical protein EOM04_01880 [Clostridia bacterium]|nr:hypothetical protein [Clostridia bacterium]
MIYFIITMVFFLIIAYIIYYRYTILSKIFVSTQLVKLGVYARLYNFFEEKTSKENATLFAEIMTDLLFSESTCREKAVLFHVLNKDAISRNMYQLSDDEEIKEMVNIGLFAEAIIKMKNGTPKEEAMTKLHNLQKFGMEIANIEKKYPLKLIMYKKANRFYKLTKSDAVKAKLGIKKSSE